jgi:Tol biopolymer transport system component
MSIIVPVITFGGSEMNLKICKDAIFKVVIVTVTVLLTGLSSPAATGPYFGQKPPGLTPEVFAPGVISVAGSIECSLSLSPKGDELFFTRARSSGWPHCKIMHMKKQGDEWSAPEVASFLKDDWATQAVFSPDGQYLYFSTSRGKPDIRYYSLWRSKKDGDGWSKPESVIDMGGGPMMEFHPTVTRDGSVYFLSWDFSRQTGDIYVARMVNGKYVEPVIVGPPISTQYNEVRPTVEPNERYLLFESHRPGGYGGTDIYIAFRDANGTWSSVRNMGPTVNAPADDDVPNISPDGKYWFSKVNDDIYWRETPAALTDPNGTK